MEFLKELSFTHLSMPTEILTLLKNGYPFISILWAIKNRSALQYLKIFFCINSRFKV